MDLKIKQLTISFFESIIGYVVGTVVTYSLMGFMETKGVTNLWGLYSNKLVVEENTFSIVNWILSVLVGFIIMKFINYSIHKIKIHLK